MLPSKRAALLSNHVTSLQIVAFECLFALQLSDRALASANLLQVRWRQSFARMRQLTRSRESLGGDVMDLEIQAQQTEIEPRWRSIIERRAKKLPALCKEVIRVHVTLVHNSHHQHGHEEVRLLVSIPGETLRVQKERQDVGEAIIAAFAALEDELKTFVQRRRDLKRQA
jgi:ribosomal subunit interface protein